MRSVTIFFRSIIQQQRLAYAYSFNTFTNTSFDAQNIVSGLIIKSKSLPCRTCQPVAFGCQLKEKATDSNDCTSLIKAPLNTNPTAEAGTISCAEVTSSIARAQSVMVYCQSPQFCSQIPPRGGHV
jgi:hypothetical protein